MSWLWNQGPSPTTGSLQAEEREERLRRRHAYQDSVEEQQHSQHLQPPVPPGIRRRHDRSPSPGVGQEQRFFPSHTEAIPPDNMATPEQLEAIKEELRREMRHERALDTAYAAARDPDIIKRKPEIPPFDKNHIEIWIRRMENSYIRAGIISVKEKFAFLETKFSVDMDPKINEFLYGDSTEDNWTSFLAYLRKEFGPTKQQRASIIIDGLKREGRRPSQYAAALEEKTKNITLDDVNKEMLLREMPVDVRRMLQERIEKLTFKDAAAIADSYFDQEGRPRHSATPSVNCVSEKQEDETEETDGINAVNFRPRHRPQGSNQNQGHRPQQQQQGRPQNRGHQQRQNRGDQHNKKPAFEYSPMKPGDTLCCYHDRWGDEARKCEVTCSRFDEKRFSGNARAGPK